MSLAVAPSPGSLVVRGGYPGPAGHQRMLPNLILVPEMMPPPFILIHQRNINIKRFMHMNPHVWVILLF